MEKTNNIWRFKSGNQALQYILNYELGVSSLLAGLMVNRGIYNVEEARLFLNGKLDDMYDPLLLKDMNKAVSRTVQALQSGEKIIIYGDYDVDGITSTAMLVSVLRRLGGDVSYYIPSRLDEGYGLHAQALEQICKEECHLIITVDCGISSVDEAVLAGEMGVDLVITDHHEPPPELPGALAVVNPKRPDCTYPFKSLAGVGVALKFVQALAGRAGGRPDMWQEYLDLACLGTVADMVPLKEENRILVKHGLEQLSRSTKPGLRALMSVSLGSTDGLNGQSREDEVSSAGRRHGGGGEILSPHAVGFYLAPRLNAAGRVGNPRLGVELLLCNDEERACGMAAELQRENQERQKLEAGVLKEALEMLENDKKIAQSKVLVLASPNWHAGVIGIVASRLVDRFYRPTLLIAIDGSEGKGSARSIPGFNMYCALDNCSDFLSGYGGHAQAAGFSIASDRVESFRRAINEYAESILNEEDLIPGLELDAVISKDLLTKQLVEELNSLAPFGHCNPPPLLAYRDMRVLASREVGRGGTHLKMLLRAGNTVFDGIGFSLGKYSSLLTGNRRVDVAFVPQIDEWNGKRRLQLKVKDFHYTAADRETGISSVPSDAGNSSSVPSDAGDIYATSDAGDSYMPAARQDNREITYVRELYERSYKLLKSAGPAAFLPEFILKQLSLIPVGPEGAEGRITCPACQQASAGRDDKKGASGNEAVSTSGGKAMTRGFDTAGLEVLDKRNCVNRELYAAHKIVESTDSGHKALILTSSPYRVVETAHCLRIRCSELANKGNKEAGDGIGFYHPVLNAAEGGKILSLFQEGTIKTLVITPAAIDVLQKLPLVYDVIAYHLPFSPEEWKNMVQVAAERLHILFRDVDESSNREKLKAFAPGRDFLAAFYALMRRQVGNDGGACTIVTEEVLKLLTRAGFPWARPCTVEVALAVFAELGFLKYQRVKDKNCAVSGAADKGCRFCASAGRRLQAGDVDFLPAAYRVEMGRHLSEKASLESSPTFCRVQQLEKYSISWQQFLLSAPVEQLLDLDKFC